MDSRVAQRIRELIVEGALPPGARVAEDAGPDVPALLRIVRAAERVGDQELGSHRAGKDARCSDGHISVTTPAYEPRRDSLDRVNPRYTPPPR